MHCQRHMHLYGTTKEQLGWLAVNSRRNAALNPRAVYREPMTMDDYLAARVVSTPFGLFDCDVPIDGSIAIRHLAPPTTPRLPKPAVRVEAIGGAAGRGGWVQRPDYPKMASVDAAAEIWSRTDLTPARRRHRRALRRVHLPHVRVARSARLLRRRRERPVRRTAARGSRSTATSR